MISSVLLCVFAAVMVAFACFVVLPMLFSSGNTVVIGIAVIIVLVPVVYGIMKVFDCLKERNK